MRAKFEAWARPRWTHPEDFDQRIGARPGTYNSYEVQVAWDAWQAATEASAEACDERACIESRKAEQARRHKEIAFAQALDQNAEQARLMARDIRARSNARLTGAEPVGGASELKR